MQGRFGAPPGAQVDPVLRQRRPLQQGAEADVPGAAHAGVVGRQHLRQPAVHSAVDVGDILHNSVSDRDHDLLPEVPEEAGLREQRLRGEVPGDEDPPPPPDRREVERFRFGDAHPSAEDDIETDTHGQFGGEGPVRGGVVGAVARREGGCEGVLHDGGTVLVQGDGDLPDGADATREHTRVHRGRHQGDGFVDADVADHGLPRERFASRLPPGSRARSELAADDGAHHIERVGPSSHGNLRHER